MNEVSINTLGIQSSKSIRLAKVLPGYFTLASRDKREVAVARELGFDITIVSSDENTNLEFCGYQHLTLAGIRISPEQNSLYRKLCVVHNFISSTRQIWRLHVDAISCHDIRVLHRAYISTVFKRRKPALIYDAHEFEVGRNTNGRRGKVAAWWIKNLERFLANRCLFTIVVNDSIADEMQRMHKLKERPIVARSTPYLFELDKERVGEIRKKMCADLNVDSDNAFLVMFHGLVIPGRGVESLIRAVAVDPDIFGIVMGDGKAAYLKTLRLLASDLGVSERILFLPSVPRDGLENYVAASDVGFVPFRAICRSHYYVLPNKFFENVQAENPVVASHFPELKRHVDQYGLGLTFDPEDIDEIVACIERLRIDKGFYCQCKENVKIAKARLCWELESEVLKKAYARLKAKLEPDGDAP